MKKMMILGGPEFQIPVVEQAHKMGLYTVVLDISPCTVCAEYADEFHVCSVKDYEKVLEIAKSVRPNAITVGMVDSAVLTAAKVCRELGLPGLEPDVAEVATNKYLMIDAFRTYDVPHPEYQLLEHNQLENFEIQLPFPIIVKPVDSAGSRGIRLIHNPSEIVDAIRESSKESEAGAVLLEEYMDGPEVSVEMLVIDSKPIVLQVTDKITSGAPYFMETGHNQPSLLPQEAIEEIKTVSCKAAKAIGLTNSIVHAELIVTSNGAKMVELGARMGGDGIQEQLLELSLGINMPEISIKLALGEKMEIPQPRLKKHSAVRFIQAQGGVIEAVRNVEEAQHLDNVKHLKIYCKKGEVYQAARDNSGRLGYVISQADSREEANRACERAIEMIDIGIVERDCVRENNLELIAAAPDEYDVYYKFRCDEGDIFWNGYSAAPDYEKMKSLYLKRCFDSDISRLGNERIYFLRKRIGDDYEDVGYVLLRNREDGFEYGHTVLKKYCGQGLGTEACRLGKKIALRYASEVYGLVRDDNIASQRTFEKNGFVRTDIMIERPKPALATLKLRKWLYTKQP